MEACGTAHPWARRLEELGHVVVLLPPQYVRPYVMRNKTDRTDVDALLEALRNEPRSGGTVIRDDPCRADRSLGGLD
jgi:transposase